MRVHQVLLGLLAALGAGLAARRDWDLAVAIEGQIELLTSDGTLVGEPVVAFTKLKALTFDNIRHEFIVSDMNKTLDTIYSVSLTQETKKNDPIIQDFSHDVQGLAIDPIDDVLYWTAPYNKTINYISLKNFSDFGVFMSFHTETPQDLAIDSCRRYIYWTNSNLDNPTIERADLDGTNRKILVNSDLSVPYGIAIDYVNGRLYWADRGEGIYFRIESTNLDGEDREIVITDTHQRPYGLAIDNHSIYWTDVNNNAIWKLKKKTDKHPNKVRGFKETPMGIIAKHLGITEALDCDKLQEAIHNYNESTYEIINIVDEETQKELLINSSKIERISELVCLNNGEITEDGCLCEVGFEGSNCEIMLCHNYCIHGTCDLTPHGYPTCRCKHGFYGKHCEFNLCYNYCLNNGKCSHDGFEPSCQCSEGFIGKRCQIDTSVSAECTTNCSNPKMVENLPKNEECNCELESLECSPMVSEYLTDPAFLVLSICLLVMITVIVALAVALLRTKHRRPRINKRIIVNKNVTPLTNRPHGSSIDQCEITIENCCNMNVCETPCFEPPVLRKTKDEKKNLLAHMETNDDLY